MAAKKKTQTISGGKGTKPVTFQKGGLHRSLGVPQGEKIPPGKMAAALRGDAGPKAQAQANMAQGMLKAGRQTAAANQAKRTPARKRAATRKSTPKGK